MNFQIISIVNKLTEHPTGNSYNRLTTKEEEPMNKKNDKQMKTDDMMDDERDNMTEMTENDQMLEDNK